MCCFSGKVDWVKRTNIFARAAGAERQYLVYEMSFAARDELAMVLPLPVPPRPREDAVRFVALDRYEHFFVDLLSGFPVPLSLGTGPMASSQAAGRTKALAVVDVGEFEASFVPTVRDFDRLDARFRMPADVWGGLPTYRDFGFAVFKLKAWNGKVHPMAFDFPRRDPSWLFFPTVHVYDPT